MYIYMRSTSHKIVQTIVTCGRWVRWMDGWMDGQKERQVDRYADRYLVKWIGRHI